MATRNTRDQAAERRHDETVEDSFPASDPPANSGVIGPRGQHVHGAGRTASRQRDDGARPKGRPTDERQTAETAPVWEDKAQPRDRR